MIKLVSVEKTQNKILFASNSTIYIGIFNTIQKTFYLPALYTDKKGETNLEQIIFSGSSFIVV